MKQKCTLDRGRSFVICGQARKDGSVSWGRRLLDHQEVSTECVCNPKFDSKRRGHQPGQKKGMRKPQMISRVSSNWLTEPQGQGVKVSPCSLRTWHLKLQPLETARSHSIQYQGTETPVATTVLKPQKKHPNTSGNEDKDPSSSHREELHRAWQNLGLHKGSAHLQHYPSRFESSRQRMSGPAGSARCGLPQWPPPCMAGPMRP